MTSTASAEILAEAAARRHADGEASSSATQLMLEHDKRQMFRRLIDPGIFRPNSREVAMDSLKTLCTIADNILRDPENPKYHTFKRENDTIQRRLVQPKGALEYALALGFRAKVMDFQSYYVFHPSRMADLRMGAAILKEAVDREVDKEERMQRSREEQKAAEAVVARNVKLAFLDDRQRKMVRDQRERELREVRQSVRVSQGASVALTPSPPPDQSPTHMPGPGYTLAAVVDQEGMDQPPPYHD